MIDITVYEVVMMINECLCFDCLYKLVSASSVFWVLTGKALWGIDKSEFNVTSY